MTICKKKYHLGQMMCTRCETIWDLDDEKPECLTDKEYGNLQMSKIAFKLNSKPEQLYFEIENKKKELKLRKG